LEKIKILTLSDHPLSPSGVGIQTRYMIEHLLRTGKYQVVSFGGAIKHENYEPQKLEEFGDDWSIFPVDGYGTPDMVRSVIRNEKPDILWFMTDPRFWGWLWEIENEIRPLMPMVYYHVWDNKPYPLYNKKYYDSNDVVVTISKVTDDIVKNVSPSVERIYLPHAVDTNIFRKIDEEEITKFTQSQFPELGKDKFLFFWNNRNARRKMTGSIIFWFKEFLDQVGHENASLVMHTDPYDPYGQDIYMLMEKMKLTNGELLLSTKKYDPEVLATLYNMIDCTINISDAEGFGLATLESLACEKPIIVSMTGGLQQQVTDGENWFGVGIEPASRAIIGSQDVPYIYEDRVCKEDFINALLKLYNMPKEERLALGKAGRDYVMREYNFKKYCNSWDEVLTNVHEKYGSWETRKNHKPWSIMEVE
jgi:glycosyltransferase involved in cell wall biosynthesis